MGSNPRQLTVATADDAPELVELYFDAFSGDEYHDNVFPRGVGDEYHLKAWTGFLTPEEGVLKPMVFLVRGGESAKIQSAMSLWTFTQADTELIHPKTRWPAPLPGMKPEALAEFFDGMASQHGASMGGKEHIHLEIIMTHSSARKSGHASALLSHAAATADQIDYPLYLDAETSAMGLYARHGFMHKKDVPKTSETMSPMLRARRSERS